MSRREGGEKREARREPRGGRGGREDAELGRREESGGSTEEGAGGPRPLAQSCLPPHPCPRPRPTRAPGRTCRAHTPPARRAAEPPSPPSARTRGGSPLTAQPRRGPQPPQPPLPPPSPPRNRRARPVRNPGESRLGTRAGGRAGARVFAAVALTLQPPGGRAPLLLRPLFRAPGSPRCGAFFPVRSIVLLGARASCSELNILFPVHPPLVHARHLPQSSASSFRSSAAPGARSPPARTPPRGKEASGMQGSGCGGASPLGQPLYPNTGCSPL